MSSKCKSCASCGMPLEQKEHCYNGDLNSDYCAYCVDKAGKLLPFEDVLKGTASYFKESQGVTEENSIKMARELLIKQPAWAKLK